MDEKQQKQCWIAKEKQLSSLDYKNLKIVGCACTHTQQIYSLRFDSSRQTKEFRNFSKQSDFSEREKSPSVISRQPLLVNCFPLECSESLRMGLHQNGWQTIRCEITQKIKKRTTIGHHPSIINFFSSFFSIYYSKLKWWTKKIPFYIVVRL